MAVKGILNKLHISKDSRYLRHTRYLEMFAIVTELQYIYSSCVTKSHESKILLGIMLERIKKKTETELAEDIENRKEQETRYLVILAKKALINERITWI